MLDIELVFSDFIGKVPEVLNRKEQNSVIEYLKHLEPLNPTGQTDIMDQLPEDATLGMRALQHEVLEAFKGLHEALALSPEYEQKIFRIWMNFKLNPSLSTPHRHPGSCFVAVYYPRSEEGTYLKLINPGSCLEHEIPEEAISSYNILNSTNHQIPVVGNTLVLMPSWQWHYVETKTPNKRRMSIAFDSLIVDKEWSSDRSKLFSY